jgi:hypothetical protein
VALLQHFESFKMNEKVKNFESRRGPKRKKKVKKCFL